MMVIDSQISVNTMGVNLKEASIQEEVLFMVVLPFGCHLTQTILFVGSFGAQVLYLYVQ